MMRTNPQLVNINFFLKTNINSPSKGASNKRRSINSAKVLLCPLFRFRKKNGWLGRHKIHY